MSETLIVIAAVLSLLLTIVYGFVKRQKNLEKELASARRIKTVAGLKLPKNASLENVLRGILSTLARAYKATDSRMQFNASAFGEFLVLEGVAGQSGLTVPEKIDNVITQIDRRQKSSEGESHAGGKTVVFVVDDQEFSCRIEMHTNAELVHTEYWYMQELIREKLSRSLLDKMEQVVRGALKDLGTPYAVIDHTGSVVYENDAFITSFHRTKESELPAMVDDLCRTGKDRKVFTSKKLHRKVAVMRMDRDLFVAFSPPGGDIADASDSRTGSLLLNALEDMNLGVVVLSTDGKDQTPDYKITSINNAFYRIFGLDGSNAQSDEVAEILSSAIRPDEADKSVASVPRPPSEFYYMRHDGLKVRARLTIVKGEDNSRVVIFEPVENIHFLMSTYRQLLEASQLLFVSGDIRAYLRAVMDVTRADGVALAEKNAELNKFEVKEKAGFIINVPQLLLDDFSTRDFINSQGYLVAPIRVREEINAAVIALKPNQEAIEAVLLAAKLLEAYAAVQGENRALRSRAARLLEDAKRADEANRSKSEFLANMSHEIRTPLNSIIGFADIIHSDTEDLGRELLLDFSGNIVVAGKHLLSLINDILDIAKVETGKMKLDPQEFSIKDVVESIGRILRPLLDKKQVSFATQIEDGVDVFVADTVKFKQILYNLLNNAISYSPSGGTVTLEMLKSGGGIEMRVSDKGIGIKKEDIDKLFKPFVQVGETHPGTGLGLVLTQRLVELHGGTIWVDSAYGQGTTVVVYLPDAPRRRPQERECKNDDGDLHDEIFFVTEDDQLYGLFTTIMDGVGFKTTKVSPKLVEGSRIAESDDSVLVVDAVPDNLTEGVISACRDAGKTLLLTHPENVRLVSELLKDYEDKLSFIDRRNFTKSELIAELNTAGRL